MTVEASHSGYREGGYLVRSPRVTDAVGGALRQSYAETTAAPDELSRLLDRLDRPARV